MILIPLKVDNLGKKKLIKTYLVYLGKKNLIWNWTWCVFFF